MSEKKIQGPARSYFKVVWAGRRKVEFFFHDGTRDARAEALGNARLYADTIATERAAWSADDDGRKPHLSSWLPDPDIQQIGLVAE